ncbi:Rieske 2Fe-2S domain-containing protein [Candidatus Poriferisocius sp.]|uniref:Rieske 2Fe-2S domain-containing protein n=1 Tax=Candidatus Poriferisocius sp. TaxID=3101276 RepID=UPI003B52C6C9
MDESRVLAVGEIKSFYAFGKDLVLYRTESGEARLIDAYCPHMGAHIGAGGKVDGDGTETTCSRSRTTGSDAPTYPSATRYEPLRPSCRLMRRT